MSDLCLKTKLIFFSVLKQATRSSTRRIRNNGSKNRLIENLKATIVEECNEACDSIPTCGAWAINQNWNCEKFFHVCVHSGAD